jgi:O-antigen ligase
MNTAVTSAPSLDRVAVAHWPLRAAAHLLGLGMVLAVLLALPAAPSDLDRFQLPKETAAHLLTWLAVLLARPAGWRGLSRAARSGLLLFAGASIASIAVATNPWVATRAVALTLTGVAAFLTARQLASQGEGAILLGWAGLAAGVGAATGLAQAYGVESTLFATTRAPGGTFGNRNFLAHFSALALPTLLYLLLTSRRRITLVPLALLATACCACVVLTRSRAAWIAAGGALILMGSLLLLLRRARRVPPIGARLMLLAAALLGGVAAAVSIPNALQWRSDSPYSDTLGGLVNTQEGSGRGRLLQYRNTLRLAAQHPLLGVGPGNWPIRYGDVAPASDPSWASGDVIPLNPWPSSDWLAVLSERGLLAIVALLLLAGSLIRRAWGARLGGEERAQAAIALMGLVSTTAAVGALDAVMLLPAPLLLVTVSTGALLATADPDTDAGSSHHGSRLLSIAVVVLGIVTARSALETAAYVVAGNGRSLSHLRLAARLDPGSYPIRIALANRLSCAAARPHIRAVMHLAPDWPATRMARRRCGA